MDEIDAILNEILVREVPSPDADPETGFTADESAFVQRILASVQTNAQCVFASLEKDGTLSFITTGSTNVGSINVLSLVIHRLACKADDP